MNSVSTAIEHALHVLEAKITTVINVQMDFYKTKLQ